MSSAALKVKIFDAKGAHLVPVSKSTATVGSASHCDVVLNHASVQAEHLRTWCEGGRIWVQDLGSVHGTTINGTRLPPLKPMLVRDLDILKLGDCPATLGFEPNLVRAPVVKPQTAVPEFTLTDVRTNAAPDGERLAREVADLKLQLQMARLEKDTGEDLRRELSASKEEISRLEEEKKKLKDSFQHVEGDKKNFKKQLEDEVAELKLKALRELKEQREEDMARFEDWKSESVTHLASQIRLLSDQKTRAWINKPVSKEMMFEWEGDLNHLFRRVLLNEKKASESVAPPIQFNAQATGSKKIGNDAPTTLVHRPASSGTSTRSHSRKKSRRGSANDGPWQRVAIGAFVLACFMAVAWFTSSFWKKEGARGMASQLETAPAPVKVGAPVAAGFKKSYTDNVLSTANYVDAELNMEFRATWLKELKAHAARDWKLDEKTIANIAGREILLIQELQKLKAELTPTKSAATIQQMRQKEAQFMRDLQGYLARKSSPEKFMLVKRNFYTRNQVYLTR